MSEHGGQFDQSPEPAMPEGLRGELRRLYAARPPVPRDLDDAVLALAAEQLRQRARSPMRLLLRRGGGAAAAAALLAIGVFVTRPYWRSAPPVQQAVSVTPAGPHDLNGDGKVNILDAYLLARQLDEKKPAAKALDVNSDGVVDRKDADAIAMGSVSLGGVVR